MESDARRLANEFGTRWGVASPRAQVPCPALPGVRGRGVLPGDAPACIAQQGMPDNEALAAARSAAKRSSTQAGPSRRSAGARS